ncbi:MAG: glycosyltransferase, partial [Dehalococcoidia bacterium]|nr:glycosyltransferase [Dehalococcoidia bacterium]
VPSRWVACQIARGLNAKAHVLYAGIEPGDWTPGKSEGYVLWNKTRVDPICDPAPVGRLAAQNSHIQFMSTFGDVAPNVRISGTLPYQENKELVRHAGIYLSTTKETFGIGTLEALACEVPVLGWAWGGNLDIVRHQETGYLATPGDYDDLAAGLEYCLTHRTRLGQAGREEVLRRFTWERAIEECAGLYPAVLEERKTSTPKVSVIVTCYNLEQYLPACLDSFKAQTTLDWDCWVVDDCSPGSCRQIVDDYAAQDPRFHYTRTPKNLYLAGARNHGIALSQGQYILPLDADDMLAPLALDVLAKHLDAQPGHAIVYGAMDVLEADGKRWTSGWPQQFQFDRQITHQNQLPYASMYRRQVWQRTGGYRARCQTAEDADFWCRASSFGFRPYRATDYPCLIKRERGDSMGHTEAEPDWTAWYPWSRSKALAPWGCAGEPTKDLSWPVQLYDAPKVSIIIPVGPGHEEHVKVALDSVQAQTEPGWECIVVNDTGQPLDLDGWPWARVLNSPAPGSGP